MEFATFKCLPLDVQSSDILNAAVDPVGVYFTVIFLYKDIHWEFDVLFSEWRRNTQKKRNPSTPIRSRNWDLPEGLRFDSW